MRSFIITLSIFLVLLICIGMNYFFIHNVHDQMMIYSTSLALNPCEENQLIILEAQKYWNSKITLIYLSLSNKDVTEISNCIDAVLASNRCEDEVELNINIEKLKNAVQSIIRLEKFQIDNIL